jgi:hypothetical protein
MSNGNWFAVSRLIFDHHLVGIKDRAFTELEAWLWLIAEAEFEPTTVMNKGQRIVLDPGQLMHAHHHLATRWKWSVDKVRWYLKRLQNEAMITRYCAKQDTQRNTNQIQIITICNYTNYQYTPAAQHQPTHQPEHQPSTNPAPSQHHQYKDNTSTPEQESPPFPPPGGERPQPASPKRKRGLTAAQIKITDAAFDRWNDVAKRLGFGQVEARTDARRARLAKRLDDIGGLDRFVLALSAIERVPFLMGKVAPKPGQAPFKLDIDRLMQTDGNLGDVLAKLIDKAGDANELVGPNGKRWGWWRGKEAEFRAMPIDYWRKLDADCKPNGTWPWWLMGAPPGHPECIMPAELVAERGYAEIYQGQITHN